MEKLLRRFVGPKDTAPATVVTVEDDYKGDKQAEHARELSPEEREMQRVQEYLLIGNYEQAQMLVEKAWQASVQSARGELVSLLTRQKLGSDDFNALSAQLDLWQLATAPTTTLVERSIHDVSYVPKDLMSPSIGTKADEDVSVPLHPIGLGVATIVNPQTARQRSMPDIDTHSKGAIRAIVPMQDIRTGDLFFPAGDPGTEGRRPLIDRYFLGYEAVVERQASGGTKPIEQWNETDYKLVVEQILEFFAKYGATQEAIDFAKKYYFPNVMSDFLTAPDRRQSLITLIGDIDNILNGLDIEDVEATTTVSEETGVAHVARHMGSDQLIAQFVDAVEIESPGKFQLGMKIHEYARQGDQFTEDGSFTVRLRQASEKEKWALVKALNSDASLGENVIVADGLRGDGLGNVNSRGYREALALVGDGWLIDVVCSNNDDGSENVTTYAFGKGQKMLKYLDGQWVSSGPVVKKPVIYAYYPDQEIKVDINYTAGQIIAEYPTRDQGGWQLTASVDGRLTMADGREFPYLFWEARPDAIPSYDMSTGFCVAGNDAVSFLEEKLSILGLNSKETADFITYWYPVMQRNKYNLVKFATSEYTDVARLSVLPSPDTMIRVFMVFKAVDQFVNVAPQELVSVAREGTVIVEWGGTNLDELA